MWPEITVQAAVHRVFCVVIQFNMYYVYSYICCIYSCMYYLHMGGGPGLVNSWVSVFS